MLYSKSREEMLQIAEELGVKIKFDSDTPGVTNIETGESKNLWSCFEDYGFHMIFTLDNLEAERIKPRENSDFTKNLNHFDRFNDCA